MKISNNIELFHIIIMNININIELYYILINNEY